tara:strand:- start:2535 stop:2759 length:225 start_codon:yes stop_codon:yes gene_type:complete
MDLKDAKAIVQYLNNEEPEWATLYEDYSGRNMYGATTAAVIIPDIGDAYYAAGALKIDARSFSRDHMGLKFVVY